MLRLPYMEVNWIKVKSHRKRDAKSFHEVINDEMYTFANTLHMDQEWQARNIEQHFASASAELKIGNTRIIGHSGKALQ